MSHVIQEQPSPYDLSQDKVPLFDADSHVCEPPDLWTSRIGSKWGDQAPRVVWNQEKGSECWLIGEHLLNGVARFAVSGWHEPFPSAPRTIADAHPGAFDANARLAYLDELNITHQVVYPNVLGFHVWAFMKFEPALRLDCVRAFNDWQVDFCSADPERLIPLAILPVWDIAATTEELERCISLGYRGINIGWQPERLGFPRIRDNHWDPMFSLAQEANLSVNFHVGFGSRIEDDAINFWGFDDVLDMARDASLTLLANANCIAELIMGRICHRYPGLRFVSVESGYGYIPYLLDALDWQFTNMNARVRHGDFLLPSEYFRRQIYGTFWFEHHVRNTIELFPDNVMFETDFPHPVSLIGQQGSVAKDVQTIVRENLSGIPSEIVRKVLYENAHNLYCAPN